MCQCAEDLSLRITDIERRFKEATGIEADLSVNRILRHDNENVQQKTSKEERDKYGFVTTPLWLVDDMIYGLAKDFDENGLPDFHVLVKPRPTFLDLCSGCGQFTIRLIRIIYNKLYEGKHFSLSDFLKDQMYFSELNPISIAKLIYIFHKNINVFIGDSCFINKAKEGSRGFMFLNKKHDWINDEEFDRKICDILDNHNYNCNNFVKVVVPIVEEHMNKNIDEDGQVFLF